MKEVVAAALLVVQAELTGA